MRNSSPIEMTEGPLKESNQISPLSEKLKEKRNTLERKNLDFTWNSYEYKLTNEQQFKSKGNLKKQTMDERKESETLITSPRSMIPMPMPNPTTPEKKESNVVSPRSNRIIRKS